MDKSKMSELLEQLANNDDCGIYKVGEEELESILESMTKFDAKISPIVKINLFIDCEQEGIQCAVEYNECTASAFSDSFGNKAVNKYYEEINEIIEETMENIAKKFYEDLMEPKAQKMSKEKIVKLYPDKN